MRKLNLSLLICVMLSISTQAIAQKDSAIASTQIAAAEQEIKQFYESYAEDLRQKRREAIADRYDRRGIYMMGNGRKSLETFDAVRDRYLNKWNGPKSFQWKDLSIDVLSRDAAVVLARFEWETDKGQVHKYSYTGVLVKHEGKWRIRVEDESTGQ